MINYERKHAEYESLRAAERALTAINNYARRLENPQTSKPLKPSQTTAKPVTPASGIARFLPDSKGTNSNPRKVSNTWGRAGKGVI